MMGKITVMSGEAETLRLTWKEMQNVKKADVTLKLYQEIKTFIKKKKKKSS